VSIEIFPKFQGFLKTFIVLFLGWAFFAIFSKKYSFLFQEQAVAHGFEKYACI